MTRWILPNLGTSAFSEIESTDAFVIDARDLVDKAGNSTAALRALIDLAVDQIAASKVVIVACDYGISRSNSIAAGIVSIYKRCSFDEAVGIVLRATAETEIKIEMLSAVRQAVTSEGSRQPENILVTGATGFIGSAFVRRFGAERRLIPVSRSTFDLTDSAVLLSRFCRENGVSQILHLAYPRIYTNASALAESLLVIRNILSVCREQDIRLIALSGNVVFSGYRADNITVDEAAMPFPKGAYGDAKYLEEALIKVYSSRGEVRCALCRFGAVYGPEGLRPRFLLKVKADALAGKTIVTHKYCNARPKIDLVYVDDAIEALGDILSHDVSGIFHFGSGHLLETAEIARLVSGICNVQAKYAELEIEDEVCNVLLDGPATRRVFNWRPRTSLGDGLAKALDLGPA